MARIILLLALAPAASDAVLLQQQESDIGFLQRLQRLLHPSQDLAAPSLASDQKALPGGLSNEMQQLVAQQAPASKRSSEEDSLKIITGNAELERRRAAQLRENIDLKDAIVQFQRSQAAVQAEAEASGRQTKGLWVGQGAPVKAEASTEQMQAVRTQAALLAEAEAAKQMGTIRTQPALRPEPQDSTMQLERIRTQIEESYANIAELRGRTEALEKAPELNEASLDAMVQNAQLERQAAAQIRQNAELEDTIVQMQKREAALKADAENAAKEIETFRTLLEKSSAELKDLHTKNDALEKENKDLAKTDEHLETEVASLQSTVASVREVIKSLRSMGTTGKNGEIFGSLSVALTGPQAGQPQTWLDHAGLPQQQTLLRQQPAYMQTELYQQQQPFLPQQIAYKQVTAQDASVNQQGNFASAHP